MAIYTFVIIHTVKFMLGGKTYLNNTIVLMSDIGEDNDALLCMTDRSDCCDGSRVGEFYYPDNTAVGFSSTNSLYRNRGPQVVRLNRRGNALSPTGVYRCQIPDSIGRMQNIYINIIGMNYYTCVCQCRHDLCNPHIASSFTRMFGPVYDEDG